MKVAHVFALLSMHRQTYCERSAPPSRIRTTTPTRPLLTAHLPRELDRANPPPATRVRAARFASARAPQELK